jgi:hypothetical protein
VHVEYGTLAEVHPTAAPLLDRWLNTFLLLLLLLPAAWPAQLLPSCRSPPPIQLLPS